MGNVDRITTFFDVVEGDFAVSMPDDTMHNPQGRQVSRLVPL